MEKSNNYHQNYNSLLSVIPKYRLFYDLYWLLFLQIFADYSKHSQIDLFWCHVLLLHFKLVARKLRGVTSD